MAILRLTGSASRGLITTTIGPIWRPLGAPAPARVSEAERRRRAKKQSVYRRRRACGIAVYKIIAVPHDVINALLETGRLNALDALDKRKVEIALGEVVSDFAKRWK